MAPMRSWQAPCCDSCATAPAGSVGALPVVHEALSLSTGSLLLDAGVGAAAGYLVAPKAARTLYAVGGAAATTLAGLLGLVGVLGVAYARRRR